jgi:hypothetical protein
MQHPFAPHLMPSSTRERPQYVSQRHWICSGRISDLNIARHGVILMFHMGERRSWGIVMVVEVKIRRLCVLILSWKGIRAGEQHNFCNFNPRLLLNIVFARYGMLALVKCSH